MASRRLFHRQNGGARNGSAGESYLRGNQIEAPLGVACPRPEKTRQQRFVRKASDRIESIEYTLETLRIMKTFFDGTSLEGDTSVRDSYMAGVVDGTVRANPDVKIILLAHNNHLQKTPVSFSGELTAVPMGQHLAERVNYRAIAFTHLGPTVPEMHFPSPKSSWILCCDHACRCNP